MDQRKARLAYLSFDMLEAEVRLTRSRSHTVGRKRTKTGCLTCRKRRIKCGEEKPTCTNCAKSKRQCEGYNHRVVFKAPFGDWPGISGFANNDQKPPQSLDGDVKFTLPHHITPSPIFDGEIKIEKPLGTRESPIELYQSAEWPSWNQSPAICFQQDTVEYLDNDYFDVESDDDSAICLSEDSIVPAKGMDNIKRRLREIRAEAYLSFFGTLDLYRPQYTANPIRDSYVAKVFANFIYMTAPTLDSFGIYAGDDTWTRLIPERALHHLGLLHSILALSTLQMATRCGYSTTPSMKHYAYSLKRVRRDLTRSPKGNLNTVATIVLLGLYEFLSGEISPMTSHLRGALTLLVSMDAVKDIKQICQKYNAPNQQGYTPKHEYTPGRCDGVSFSSKNMEYNTPESQIRLRLYWICAKQDILRCILDGSNVMVDYNTEKRYWPLESSNVMREKNETFDQLIDVLLPITKFSSTMQKRTPWAGSSKIINEEQITVGRIDSNDELEMLKQQIKITLETIPLPTFGQDSPFGSSMIFPKLSSASSRAKIHMSRILLQRSISRPRGGVVRTAHYARKETHEDALIIGRIIAGIDPRDCDPQKCPELPGVWVDCLLPLFVASLQYTENEQRSWTVRVLLTISTITGWPTAAMISTAVQIAWKNMWHMGQGPRWEEIAPSGPKSTESTVHQFPSLPIELYEPSPSSPIQDWKEDSVSREINQLEIKPNEVEDRVEAQVSDPILPIFDEEQETIVEEDVLDKISLSPSITNSSDTERSQSSDDEETLLVMQRRRVVDHVMEYFHSIFRTMPSYRSRGQDEHRKRSCTGNHDDTTNATTFRETTNKLTTVQQQKRERDIDDDSNDEDATPPKRPRKGKGPVETGQRKRKFACPYFKRNSEKYMSKRSCVGPGWDEVRRVKEHLYRTHVLPIFCPRCYEVFKLEILLRDHQRAEPPCSKRPEEIIEGFDKPQEKKLRSRKKSQPEPNEEDKWREMYKILFPADDETMMPSPYLELDWEKAYQNKDASSGNELARYEQFLRRELPPAVRQELEKAVEKEFSPLEERLKGQLIDIVRDLQLRLFQSYTETRQPNGLVAPRHDSSLGESVTETLKVEDSLFFEPNAGAATELNGSYEVPTLENELASFEPPPPLDDTESFNPVLFQLDQLDGFGNYDDSAYSSMFSDYPYWSYAKGEDKFDEYRFDPAEHNGEGPSRPR